MYCPIESKKSKLESCCIICSTDSFSADNNGELTSIFLNYLFPPADKEEITIKLLRLFTFCKNCGSILDELIELHKSFECIQNNIRNTVKNIKCSILKNRDDGKITDANVRKFRKIATRDYCPKVILGNADVVFSKSGPIQNNSENQVSNNTDVQYGQFKRSSIQTKDGCQTSVNISKSLNSNSCDNRRNSLETESNATSLSPTLTSFSTECDTVDYNLDGVQSNPNYNQIANEHEFSEQQSRIRSTEVIIPMESNFSFAEEEGTVKFEPWNQINQEELAKDNYLQHASQEQNVIIENSQEIYSDAYNGSDTLQQSHNSIAESQTLSTKQYPASIASFSMSCETQSLDAEDKAIKSTLWKPPDCLPADSIKLPNAKKRRKASSKTATKNHSTHLWIPQSPENPSLSQVNNTQTVRVQKLIGRNNVTTHSANSGAPEGFSRIDAVNNTKNVSMDNINHSSPSYRKSVIKRHQKQSKQRKKIQAVTVTDISPPTKKYCSPPFTFAQMIFIAITSSANHCATPDAIWEFIENLFPFYKDHYHLKRMACQLLIEGSEFEETYPEPKKRSLSPLPQMYFVKRSAVTDFVNQIKIQITTCDAPPSDYMTNSDHYLKRALGDEYDNVVPLATTPTANYSNRNLIINQGENMNLQKNENDDVEIIEEVTRAPTYNDQLISSAAVESNNYNYYSFERTFDKPPLTIPILAAFVLAYSDKDGLTCPAICELMRKRFPFYENQQDTLPKRLYDALKPCRFFVHMFHGLSFSLFHLNIGNEEAMQDLKKQFRRLLLLNPEYICQFIANPHELEAIARKTLGTDFDSDLDQNFQRLFNYISRFKIQ